MFFVKDTYCKIWKITAKEKYTDISISTSEKDNREEGKYINSNWFARCVGKAHNQIAKMSEGDRAKIVSGKVTNESYEKDGEKKSAVRVTIFEFESADNNSTTKATTKTESKPKTETIEDFAEIVEEQLPF